MYIAGRSPFPLEVAIMYLLLPVLALAAAPLPAPPGEPTYIAHPTLVTAADPSLPIYAAPPGVGYDGVAGLLVTKTTGTFLCTGSLFGGTHSHVVTAAHCLTDATSVDAVFFPPAGGTVVVTTSSYSIKPGYTGAVLDENDIGLIDLGTSVSAVESYSLFTGDAVGRTYDEVGFGASGTGATGVTVGAGLRRHGFNRFDFTAADPTFGSFFGGLDILFADFDNGLAAQDASCGLASLFTLSTAPYCDLGLGAAEVMAASGDSGGPLFVDGQLAAVSSFGLTFVGDYWDVDDVLNSSFGEFGGFVPVAPHRAWLVGQVVPEPATLLLLLTGLLALGIVRRRPGSTEA